MLQYRSIECFINPSFTDNEKNKLEKKNSTEMKWHKAIRMLVITWNRYRTTKHLIMWSHTTAKFNVFFSFSCLLSFCPMGHNISAVPSSFNRNIHIWKYFTLLHLYNETFRFFFLSLLLSLDMFQNHSYCSLSFHVAFVSLAEKRDREENGPKEKMEPNQWKNFMYSTHCDRNSFLLKPLTISFYCVWEMELECVAKEISMWENIAVYIRIVFNYC